MNTEPRAGSDQKGQCMKWTLADAIIARVQPQPKPQPATNSNTHVIAGTPAPLPTRRPGIYRPTRLPHPDEVAWTSDKEAELDRILCEWV